MLCGDAGPSSSLWNDASLTARTERTARAWGHTLSPLAERLWGGKGVPNLTPARALARVHLRRVWAAGKERVRAARSALEGTVTFDGLEAVGLGRVSEVAAVSASAGRLGSRGRLKWFKFQPPPLVT